MNTYMVSIQLPDELTEDFISLIPKQREMIDELMNEGKILQYALAIDRSKLWITLSADSKKDVLVIISAFPLIDYMKPNVFELAFYNSISTELPKLIMN
ncbi:MAG: muconolactone Delta-isomerase family protein [Bacteroidota bacterium]